RPSSATRPTPDATSPGPRPRVDPRLGPPPAVRAAHASIGCRLSHAKRLSGMDVSRALSPASDWSLSTIGQAAGRMAMAAAADPDADLAAHLQDLADAGDIEGFLGQVRDAIALAGGDRT